MSRSHDIAQHIGPQPLRANTDHAKNDQIQRQARELRPLIDRLSQQTHDMRDDIQHALTFLPASAAARAHWREGDREDVFLQMPEEIAVQFPAEVRAARRISQDRAALAELHTRLDALNTRYVAMSKLARACQDYASTQD